MTTSFVANENMYYAIREQVHNTKQPIRMDDGGDAKNVAIFTQARYPLCQ